MMLDPSDPELLEILSFTCIDCARFAHVLQAAGYPIPRKAEAEQAHVLLWMLSLYHTHGKEWRTKGSEFLKALRDANTEVRHARAESEAAPSVEGPSKSRPGPER